MNVKKLMTIEELNKECDALKEKFAAFAVQKKERVHKEPELVLCMQSADCSFMKMHPSKDGLVKRIGVVEYEFDGKIFDLLEDQLGQTWLGHWNDGPKPPELVDKWLCEFWDDEHQCSRGVGFYDAENSCSFTSITGYRDGTSHNNYKPIPRHEWPEWAVEAQKKLED